MKRGILGVALALAITAIVVPFSTYARSVDQLSFSVNGNQGIVRITNDAADRGFSVKDVAKAMGATITWDEKNQTATLSKLGRTVELKANSDLVIVNGNQTLVNVMTTIIDGTMFGDLEIIVEGLGGEIVDMDDSAIFVSIGALIENTSKPLWINNNKMIVASESNKGIKFFNLETNSGDFVTFIEEGMNVIEMTAAKDGSKVAFSTDKGHIYTINFENCSISRVSKDTSIKSELQWSAKGDSLYFIQGEKSNAIAKLTIADGKISTVFDDKVNYKSDFRISEDEYKVVYAVTKDGVAIMGANGEVESIDTSNTEPQLFMVDLIEKEPKAVKLTESLDNKSSVLLLKGGQVAYVSADMLEPESNISIKLLNPDVKTSKTLLGDMNVINATLIKGDTILALAMNEDGEMAIYEVNSNGVVKKIIEVDLMTTQLFSTADGINIAVTIATEAGEKIAILRDGKMINITK